MKSSPCRLPRDWRCVLQQGNQDRRMYVGLAVPYSVMDPGGNPHLALGSPMWRQGWGGENKWPSVLETKQTLTSQKAWQGTRKKRSSALGIEYKKTFPDRARNGSGHGRPGSLLAKVRSERDLYLLSPFIWCFFYFLDFIALLFPSVWAK